MAELKPCPFCGGKMYMIYKSKDNAYFERLDEEPTIEAEPVKHGRWKEHGYKWQCSSCGILMDIDGTPKENLLNYCPNCGTKMDEEDEE